MICFKIKLIQSINLKRRLLLLNKFNILKQCSFDDYIANINDIVKYSEAFCQHKHMVKEIKCRLIYITSFSSNSVI